MSAGGIQARGPALYTLAKFDKFQGEFRKNSTINVSIGVADQTKGTPRFEQKRCVYLHRIQIHNRKSRFDTD